MEIFRIFFFFLRVQIWVGEIADLVIGNVLWSSGHYWACLGSAKFGDGAIQQVDLIKEIDG
jgi:hypothetical protein